ncbi:hypothetical protein BN1723_003522 [Verticillium longisporum]|uniref:Uncharacterized protein n=1 Tax=Verticillium longisporum TaxID=100787 RepID=A0A0G4M3H1_VERLO|nr:hypothetical protein BN1723_003522 [Verticillium longisporum]
MLRAEDQLLQQDLKMGFLKPEEPQMTWPNTLFPVRISRQQDAEHRVDHEAEKCRSRRDDDAYYDRDRRDREDERERTYRRRIDSYDELPYGDERPSGSRRRRDDDDADRRDSRDSKRVKREKTPRERETTPPRDVKTKSPLPPTATTAAAVTGKKEAKEDDAGVHSGSEEGEIEED